MKKRIAFALSFALVFQPCLRAEELGASELFRNRPAFSGGDQPAQSWATCEEVRPMSVGLVKSEVRIDLSVVGVLTAVQTDGPLWYLIMCSGSDVRIMCVTYQSNDMKVGDRVLFQGGYSRLDSNHVMLDPCLANRP